MLKISTRLHLFLRFASARAALLSMDVKDLADDPSPANNAAVERELRAAILCSVVIGVILLVIKWVALWLTNSTAIFADLIESAVHLLAVLVAAYSLRLSQKPPDSDHPYGHTKVSFFSAGFEGGMIFLAAMVIGYHAFSELLNTPAISRPDVGLYLTALTLCINTVLGIYLLRKGQRHQNLILEANGKHILTDALTSVGVMAGLLLVVLTGWGYWDPICAIMVAANILKTALDLMIRSATGLMDTSNSVMQKKVQEATEAALKDSLVSFHALRHRDMGDGHWVEVHLVFPEDISLHEAHRQASQIEEAMKSRLPPRTMVTTHLEPLVSHNLHHADARAQNSPADS